MVAEPLNITDYGAKGVAQPIKVGEIGKGGQGNRIYSIEGKSVAQTASSGGIGSNTGLYAEPTHKNLDKSKPIYEVKDGMITIKDRQYPIKLSDGYYIIRKLTPVECERLQTMPTIVESLNFDFDKKEIYFDKWYDLQKIDAQYAEEKCLKSQKHAFNVENVELKEFVQSAEKNLNLKRQQTKKPALLNVHINSEVLNNLKNCLKEKKKNVNIAEKSFESHKAEEIVVFAQSIVGMRMLLEKMRQVGKVELRQNDKCFAIVQSGRMQLLLSGEEIMQLAKDVAIDMTTVEKLIISTTLEASQNIQMLGQMLTTLFFYVLNVIDLSTQNKTFKKISFLTKRGYTEVEGVSSTQRYKALGNGWTAEVIIHLLNGALKDVPRDEEIVVLSMYDGIATGRYCLDKMGFTNVKYYAYEIDKYAIKIAMKNYPDIIQCGDAFAVREDDWEIGYSFDDIKNHQHISQEEIDEARKLYTEQKEQTDEKNSNV